MGIGAALNTVAEKWGQAASKFLPDVCTIKRNEAENGAQVLNAKHENVPCGLKPMGSGGGGQPIRAKAAYRITMPANLSGTANSVKVEDLIVVDARGIQPVKTYKVQSVENDGIKIIARGTIEA